MRTAKKTATVKAETTKTGVQLERRALAYSFFGKADGKAKEAQGQLTLAAGRNWLCAQAESAVSNIGKTVALWTGEEFGAAAFSGTRVSATDDNGKACAALQAGKFVVALERAAFIGDYAGAVAFIKKHGRAVALIGTGKLNEGERTVAVLGEATDCYQFGITAAGRMVRFEQNTNTAGVRNYGFRNADKGDNENDTGD